MKHDDCKPAYIGNQICMFQISFQKQKLLFSILQDGNGTIENEELKGFLKDLLELVKKVLSL